MANEPLDILQINIQSDASQAADGLTKLASAMKAVQRASKRGLDVKEYADGLSELAGKVSSLNIDKLESLAGAMATIQTASRGFTTSVNNAAKAVENLNNAGKSASTAKSYPEMLLPDVSKMRQKINVAQELLKRYMSSTTPDFMKQLPAVRNWNPLPDEFTTPNFEIIETTAREVSSEAGEAIKDNIGTALMVVKDNVSTALAVVGQDVQQTTDNIKREFSDAVQTAGGTGANKLEFGKGVYQDAMREYRRRKSLETQRKREEAKAAAEDGEEDNSSARIDNLRNKLSALGAVAKRVGNAVKTALVAPFRILARVAGAAIARVGSAIKTALILPLKTFGNSITNTVKKFTGFIRAIGRIALYRAIRSALKAITQSLNEGIQNLYQWSLFMDRTFADSMDSIATSMQYLHNGFASMFSPLINYAAPIIEEVTNKIVDMFNVVQQVFAALTGATTWTKAVRVQKQYAEAVTETGNAADKAMHQLMAFDELNVINSPSDSGRGANGNKNPDYGSMFTTETVNTQLANWVQEIKNFFDSGDFKGLGRFIAERLNEVVNQWEAELSGSRFGTAVKHILDTINGFLETFEFYNLGLKVAEWINGFISAIQPQDIIDLIRNTIKSISDFIRGQIDTLKWDELGRRVAAVFIGIFEGIKAADVARLIKSAFDGIRQFVKGFVNEFAQWFQKTTGETVDRLGTWLGEKLNNLLSRWQSYESGVSFGAAIQRVLEQVNQFLKTFNFYDLGAKLSDWIKGMLDGITAEEIAEGIFNVINAGINFLAGMSSNLAYICRKIGYALGNAFANIDWSSMSRMINNIIEGLIAIFSGALDGFFNNGGWKKAWEGFKELSLPAKLALTIPIAFALAKGVSLISLILESLGVVGALAASLPAGLVAVGAGGLVLTLTLSILLTKDEKAKLFGVFDEYFGGSKKRPGGGGHWDDDRYGVLKDIRDHLEDIQNSGPLDKMNQLGGMFNGGSGDINRWGSNGRTSGGHTPVGHRGLSVFADQMTDILKGTMLQLENIVEYSDLPIKSANMITSSANKMKTAIDAANLPGKATEVGNSSGEGMKSGLESTAVPAKFKSIATTSISEFGKQDFAGSGRNAGNAIRSGMDSSGISSAGTQAANSIITGIRNATSALSSAGWQSGAAFGQNFKSALAQYVSTEINATIGSGASLIRAHIQARANGGYVTQGSLFLAGEVPGQAEMLGSINGRTGVASGTEITGIGEAVRQTGAEEAALLRQTNTLLQALLAKDPFGTPSSAAGRWISQSQQAYKAVTG